MTSLRAIDQSLPLQLLRAREAAMALFRPILRKHNVTEQQWRVLRVLAAEDRLDTTELAHRCCLLSPSLTRILHTLEANNYLKRRHDPNDLRRTYVSLTAKGQRKYEEISPYSEQTYKCIEQHIGAENLQHLNQLLDDLCTALEEAQHA